MDAAWKEKMESCWLERLRVHRPALCRFIEPEPDLFSRLESHLVFNKRLCHTCQMKNGKYNQVSCILDSLVRRSFSDFENFCLTLIEIGQSHVVTDYLSPGSAGKTTTDATPLMNEPIQLIPGCRERIRNNFVSLLEDINPDDGLYTHLVSLGIIPEHIVDTFQSVRGRSNRVSAILNYLSQKRPDEDLAKFCVALRATHQTHIVERYLNPAHSTHTVTPGRTDTSLCRRDSSDSARCSGGVDEESSSASWDWGLRLIEQRTKLVEMIDPTDLIYRLEVAQIMNRQAVEMCQEEPDVNVRVEYILDHMRRRSNAEFTRFCRILTECGQGYIVTSCLTPTVRVGATQPTEGFSQQAEGFFAQTSDTEAGSEKMAPRSAMDDWKFTKNDQGKLKPFDKAAGEANELVANLNLAGSCWDERMKDCSETSLPTNCPTRSGLVTQPSADVDRSACTTRPVPQCPDLAAQQAEACGRATPPLDSHCVSLHVKDAGLGPDEAAGDAPCAFVTSSRLSTLVADRVPEPVAMISIAKLSVHNVSATAASVNAPVPIPLQPPGIVELHPAGVKVRQTSQQFYRANQYKSYPMFKTRRGLCYIVNMHHTQNHPNRDGSQVDGCILRALFEQLHFKVEERIDLTAQEIKELVQTIAQNPDLEQDQCLVLFFLSHGAIVRHNGRNVECIYGSDGQYVIADDDVLAPLTDRCCPQLKDRPRLVFFQACRGRNYDQSDSPSNDQLDSTSNETTTDSPNSYADFLILFPTQSEFRAFRNTTLGSWYVNAIVRVFMEHAHDTGVCALMNRVNRMVSSWSSNTNEERSHGKTQIAVHHCHFRQDDLFFFPGIVCDESTA